MAFSARSLISASRWARPWPAPARAWLFAAAALALGLLIARLPVTYGAALLVGAALAAAAVWEPALGLGLALALGPAKAFLAIARPDLPSDLGQVFFALAAAGWLARGLARREIRFPRIPLLLPLGLYIFAGSVSLLPALALDEGLKELLKWLEIAAAVIILVAEAERGRAKWIVGAILLAGAAQAVIGLWQFELQDPARGPEHFRILGDHFRAYGSFEQPNPYGGFLGLIWPVAAGLAVGSLSRRQSQAPSAPSGRRWLPFRLPARLAAYVRRPAFYGFSALAVLCLLGLYASFSRGAWLGAAAAAVIMTVALPRRLAVGLGLLAAALAAGWGLALTGLIPPGIAARLADVGNFVDVADVRGVNINDVNFAVVERLAHWQAAEGMARAHPWLGVGLGNYAAAYPDYRLANWPNALGHAHMIYLNVLAETGLLGLVTYVILWGSVFALTMHVIFRATGTGRGLALGLLGAWTHLAVHQLVDNLYVNNLHFLLAALLALLVYLDRQGIQHMRRSF